MTGPSDKQTLLDLMELHRAAWDDLISQFSKDHLVEPGAIGDWSVKDVIAHVAAYEDWTAEQMEATRQGEVVSQEDFEAMGAEGWYDVDNRNGWLYAQMKDVPLEQVLAQSEQAFNRLLQAVDSTSDEDLQVPQWWTNGRALIDTIPGQTYEHYDQHMDALKSWLACDSNAA